MTREAMALLSLAAAFFVSALFCRWIINQKKSVWLDQPSERSLHSVPVPRLGGIAIWSGFIAGSLISWTMLRPMFDVYCSVAAILLLFVAVLDDRKTLKPVVRLCAQFVAAVLVIFGGKLYVSWNVAAWMWPVVGVLVLLWGINLYNFMDGMDGFAGSMAIIGFSALAVLGLLHGQSLFALLCGLVVFSSAGFLCFNFPPARIFMGDSGSTVLGFAMVVVSIIGWKEGLYPFWSPLVIFSPFWVDATVTLLLRLYRREPIWLPHRQHFYQRWVLAGCSHRQVTVAYGLVMILCAVSAIVWQLADGGYNEAIVPVGWIVFYSLAWLYGNRLITRKQKPEG